MNLGSVSKSSPLVLIILDGWGFSMSEIGNAIVQANTPVIDDIRAKYPFTLLQAASLAVGMDWGESGNSEVGHLTIGTGRIIEQYPLMIKKSIKSGNFFSNPSLNAALESSLQKQSNVHIAGLITSGSVHAHFDHLSSLIKLSKDRIADKSNTIFLHLFLDGKDSGLKEGADLIDKLQKEFENLSNIKIATIIGRNFAMDRDSHWDMTQKAYELIVKADGEKTSDIKNRLTKYYDQEFNDSIIPPTASDDYLGFKDGDSIIFFNFREDSMRQITKAFIGGIDFTYFPIQNFPKTYIVTMTPYLESPNIHPAFSLPKIKNTLAEVISQNKLRQLHIAETDKYAHVTFFFNGLNNNTQEGEDQVFIKSDKSSPKLSAPGITQRVLEEIEKEIYSFIVINLANADILAHEGNLEKTKAGIECIDEMIGLLKNKILARNGIMMITADHANAESMTYQSTGTTETKHNNNPVPFILLGEKLINYKNEDQIASEGQNISGILADVAPTILDIIGIQKPAEMTGESLLDELKLR